MTSPEPARSDERLFSMRLRRFCFAHGARALLITVALCAADAGAQQVESVDVSWVGTYRVAEVREVEDPTAPTGRRYISSGPEPIAQTTRIPAAVGTRFGIGFVLKGSPAGHIVPYRVAWRYPSAGVTNPETRTTTFEWKSPPYSCALEWPCFAGYPLRYPWELTPGEWKIEIWVEDRKVVETSFELFQP